MIPKTLNILKILNPTEEELDNLTPCSQITTGTTGTIVMIYLIITTGMKLIGG